MFNFISRFRKRIGKFSCYVVLCCLVALLQPVIAEAAVITWDGGGVDNDWDTAENWSGDIAPGNLDDVVFDNTSIKDATININVIVRSITVAATYSGTITQNVGNTVSATVGGYSQAAGNFVGSNSSLTFTGFTLSGGTFTSTTGVMSINGSLIQSGGTFNHSNGTVNVGNGDATVTLLSGLYNLTLNDTLDDDSIITFTNSFTVENNMSVQKSASSDIYVKQVVGAGNPVITVMGNINFPSISNGETYLEDSFSIELHGNFSISDSDLSIWTPILFTGLNAQTLSRTAGTVSGDWTINKAANSVSAATTFISSANLEMLSGDFTANNNQVRFGNLIQNSGTFTGGISTVTLAGLELVNGTFDSTTGNLIINGDFNQQGGTFNHNNGTVTIAYATGTTNYSIESIDNFNNFALSGFDEDVTITFANSFTVEGNFTASAAGSNPDEVRVVGVGNPVVTILGNISLPSAGGDLIFENNFSIELYGNFSISDSSIFLDTPITFLGANPQTLSRTTGSITGDWTISKTAGSVSASTAFATSANLEMQTGDFATNNNQVRFGNFVQQSGTFSGGNSTITFTSFQLVDGTFDSTSGTLIINRDYEQQGGTFNHNNGVVNIAYASLTANYSLTAIDNFYNLIFSGFDEDVTITLNSSLTVENDLTASTSGSNPDEVYLVGVGNPIVTILGNFSLPSAGGADFYLQNSLSIELHGNFSIADNDLFLATPVTFSGSDPQTITRTGGSISGLWTINKAASTVTPTANFTKTGAINIDSGTLSAAGFNISAGSIVIEDGGILQLRGNETITAPTSNTNAIIRFVGDGDGLADSYTVSNLTTTFYHLEINSVDGATDTFLLGNNIIANGNFELLAGAFDVTAAGCGGSSCNMTVRGDWIREGTFQQRTGTVSFEGSGPQTIYNSNSWYGLTITAADPRTVSFESGATQSVLANGALNLTGSGCDVLTLAPSVAATDWFIDVADLTVTQNVSRVSVSYSDASGETIDADDGTVTDGGNNTNWTFAGVPAACGPQPVISSAATNPTNVTPIPITIQFSEAVVNFVVGDLTVANGNAGNFVAVDGDTFTADITPTGQGLVTVDIAAGAAENGNGDNSLAATQFNRTFDSAQPTVVISSSEASPTFSSPIPITVEFSENVTGFVVGDIAVGNGNAGNFIAVDGNTYTAEITPMGDGVITVDIAAAVAQDSAGNGNTISAQFSITYGPIVPTLVISSAASNPTNSSPIPVAFEFSENVTGFVIGDIVVGNGTADNFVAVDGNSYTAEITPNGQGIVTVNVAAGAAQDVDTNDNLAAAQLSRTFDSVAPTVSVSSVASSPTNSSSFFVTIQFSEAVSGFVVGDIATTSATVSDFVAIDADTYTARITPTAQGLIVVNVLAAVTQDSAGNSNSAAPQFSLTYDSIRPTVVISSSESSPTESTSFPVTFTFSEDVSGFAIGDISVTNGSAANFTTLNSRRYRVNISPAASGPVIINLAAGRANDQAGNANFAAAQFSITYLPETEAETFSVSGRLFYRNELGSKTLFFENDSRSSDNAANDEINDIWVEAYRHDELGKKILVDMAKVRRVEGGEGISSFTFNSLPATELNEDGSLITRKITVYNGAEVTEVDQVVGGYTFLIRAYDNSYSVSRSFQLDKVDNRVDNDPASPRFGLKLLGCDQSELGEEESLKIGDLSVQKDPRCLFDPLVLDQDLSNLDHIVNGCVHDSDSEGIVVERQMGEDRTCYVTRDRNDIARELKPSNPENLVATQGETNSGVSLSWDSAERVDYYRVYRSQYLDQNEEFAQRYEELSLAENFNELAELEFVGEVVQQTLFPADKLNPTVTYLDKTAVPGVRYDYVVRAFNPAGRSAFSNLSRGWRSLVGGDLDRDGDGVSDAQEVEDGTDFNDPESFIIRLKSPAYAKYNTFFGQFNWLELQATGTAKVYASIFIYDNLGNLIGEPQPVSIEPGRKFDIDIHRFVASDSYGVVRVEFNDSTPGVELQGQISNFRLRGDVLGSHSFALSRELKNFDQGALYATSNSIDPQGMGNLVANWLELSNHDSVERRFTRRIYDIDGRLISDSEKDFDEQGRRKPSISVPAFGEIDLQAGHEFGQGVFLIEIIPHDGATNYSASVVRYSYKAAVDSSALDFNFALPLQARKGGAENLYLSSSNQSGECWTQSNWVEIVNTRAANVAAKVLFYNSQGERVGESNLNLAPFAQQHLNASILLGAEQFGYVKIISEKSGAVIAQGGNYYHDCNTNSLQTATVLEARRLGGIEKIGSFNTFLQMENLLTISNPSSEILPLSLEIVDFDRSQEKQYLISANGSLQLDLSNFAEFGTQSDSYGAFILRSENSNSFFAQTIRRRQVGNTLDFSVPSLVK